MLREKHEGKIFGYLSIDSYDKNGYYLCTCLLCKEKLRLRFDVFTKRGQISCGCHHNNFRINDKIGLLIVKRKVGLIQSKTGRPHNYIHWECLCDCGNKVSVPGVNLNNKHTKSCGCLVKKFDRTRKRINNTIIPIYLFNQISRGALARKLEFNISIDYIYQLLINCNFKCMLSGLELTLPKNSREKNYTASLDRIDSNNGYVEGNVQWVHKHVNLMKNSLSQDYFLMLCGIIVNKNNIEEKDNGKD